VNMGTVRGQVCRFATPFDTGNGPRFNANCPTLPKHTPALCDSAITMEFDETKNRPNDDSRIRME